MQDTTDHPETGEIDDTVTVSYRSRRSGNVKTRTGTITAIAADDPDHGTLVYVETDESADLTHRLTVVGFEDDPDTTHHVWSVTMKPDEMTRETHEDGTVYEFTYDSSRIEQLGPLTDYEVTDE